MQPISDCDYWAGTIMLPYFAHGVLCARSSRHQSRIFDFCENFRSKTFFRIFTFYLYNFYIFHFPVFLLMRNTFFEIVFHLFHLTFFLIVFFFDVFETYIFQVIFYFSMFIFRKILFRKPDVCNLLSAVRNFAVHKRFNRSSNCTST